jgi:hypothetical protein
VPPTIVVLLTAYHADLLASVDPTSAAAADQGRHVAIVLLLCALAAGVARFATVTLDNRLAARNREPWSRRRSLATAGGALSALLVVAVLAGAPSWVSTQFDKFLNAAPTASKDLRNRLTDPSSNGRKDHWDAALKGFSSAPLRGQGAGTYEFTWDRYRKTTLTVVDGHSLYFEVLSEFGLPGLFLIVATIGLILWTLFRGIRGPNRMVYAALFAAVLAWAIHAGVDWDWEMPAVTAWVFGVGGAALAGRASARPPRPMGDRGRIPIAAALLVVAVTPALLMLSQVRLQASARAFEKGSCKTATSEAVASINLVGIHPQPYQIVGYCNIENGRAQDAVAAFKKAVEQQPRSWEYHYGLGLAQAYAGADPRLEIAEAGRLNPLEPMVHAAASAFAAKPVTAWSDVAKKLEEEARVSGRLTLR